MENIRFKDLSVWLKIAAIGGWAALLLYSISFLVGLITAILGVPLE